MRTLATMGAALAATNILALATPMAAHAQAFADAKSSRAGYSGGSLAPKQSCEALADLKVPELVKITATSIAAQGATPAHCRVSGVIDPEVAFEVNLPATWNGRFYMIGNGGLASVGPEPPMPCQRCFCETQSKLPWRNCVATWPAIHVFIVHPGCVGSA